MDVTRAEAGSLPGGQKADLTALQSGRGPAQRKHVSLNQRGSPVLYKRLGPGHGGWGLQLDCGIRRRI